MDRMLATLISPTTRLLARAMLLFWRKCCQRASRARIDKKRVRVCQIAFGGGYAEDGKQSQNDTRFVGADIS